MTIIRELELPEDEEVRFNEILDRLAAKYDRLERQGIVVSQFAREVMILAIAAIVSEPNREWPEFNRDDKINMQDNFVDALAYNFLLLSHQLRKSYSSGDRKVQFFDVVDAIANNSWCTWCMITATPNT